MITLENAQNFPQQVENQVPVINQRNTYDQQPEMIVAKQPISSKLFDPVDGNKISKKIFSFHLGIEFNSDFTVAKKLSEDVNYRNIIANKTLEQGIHSFDVELKVTPTNISNCLQKNEGRNLGTSGTCRELNTESCISTSMGRKSQ